MYIVSKLDIYHYKDKLRILGNLTIFYIRTMTPLKFKISRPVYLSTCFLGLQIMKLQTVCILCILQITEPYIKPCSSKLKL